METDVKVFEYKERIDLFIVIWSITTLFHQLSFYDYWFHFTLSFCVSLFCVLTILLKSQLFFLCALFANVIFIFNRLGVFVANHIFFEWIINSVILLIILVYFIKSKIKGRSFYKYKYNIVDICFPFIRSALIILYFFVVFHKLNYDFFNTDLSCGSVFFTNLLDQYGLGNLNFSEKNLMVLKNISIYFTIASEALIPILLINKKYRRFGILYGVIFHLILSLYLHGGVYSFSGLMLCYYVTFFPEEFIKKINSLYSLKSLLVIASLSLVFLLCYYSIGYFSASGINSIAFGLSFFLAYACFYLYNYIDVIKKQKKCVKVKNSFLAYFKLNIGTGLALIIIMLNGCSPYLGLKTQASFAMFSNLRTEKNDSNHFFISSNNQVFSYQTDVVTILKTDIDELIPFVDSDKQIVLYELITIINELEVDFNLDFNLNGTVSKIEKINNVIYNDRGIDLKQSYLGRKYLKFRPIYTEVNYCQH